MLTNSIDPRQGLDFRINENTKDAFAVTVYIIKDGKVLLMRQTKPHTVVAGYYVGIGGKTSITTNLSQRHEKTRHDVIISAMQSGKFALGESMRELGARETNEETGLSLDSNKLQDIGITVVRLLNGKSDELWYIQNFIYYADGTEGELKDCDEGILEWIPIEDVKNIKMLPHDKIILGEKSQGMYIESINDDIHGLKRLRIKLEKGEETLYILVTDFDSEDYEVSGDKTQKIYEIPAGYQEITKHIPEDKLREILGKLRNLEKEVGKINQDNCTIDIAGYLR